MHFIIKREVKHEGNQQYDSLSFVCHDEYGSFVKEDWKRGTAVCFFDKIHLYNEKKLDRNFRHLHSQYFKDYPRGYGYWIWKSYLISKIMLEKMHQGDILVYLDAGCEIHVSGRKRWEEYKGMLIQHSMLVFVQESQPEIRWTKYDLFAHFLMADNDLAKYSPQFFWGGTIMKKNDFTMQFVND